ncbi:hypothetical protein Pcinc_000131 [Petrolisthes cinctipes]|uniref:Uncharacterized protein n=1 Tax=Petrolisthes cinctipes TaxID=88211 RepID=A0AAE1GQG2_PETCI|nr:hypothetical protein Pcinc_000131 [Petrolisthes cinctipes]
MKNPVPIALEFRQAIKVISVAQFLKCPSTGSYAEDEREFFAEFLDNAALPEKKSIATDNNDDDDEDSTSLSIDQQTSDSVLSKAEQCSLYNLAGYCISRVKKCSTRCSACLQTVELEQPFENCYVQTLTKLKEYKENCLTHCSEKCLNLFMAVENIFREFQSSFGQSKNLVEKLVRRGEECTQDIDIPSCYDIKKKL